MKLLHTFHLIVLLMISVSFAGAQEMFQPSARFQAMSEATSGLSGCWSVFGNQAGLAVINSPEIGGSFQNRFLIHELSSQSGLFAIPVLSSVFAISLYQFGEIPFRQEKYGLAFAHRLTPKINFGLQFNYNRIFFSEDNLSKGTVGLEFGFQYQKSTKTVFGLHIINPYQTGIQLYSGKFKFPSQVQFGTFYQLSESFSIAGELENEFDRSIKVKSGFELSILEKFFIRAGASGKPYQLSAGMGFKLKKLTMDLACLYNQYLGSSPSVSFQYKLK